MSEEIKQPEADAAETSPVEQGGSDAPLPTQETPVESVAAEEAATPVAVEEPEARTDVAGEPGAAEPGSGLDDELDDDLDGEPDPEPEVAPAGPIEELSDDDEQIELNWYILKVQSNRERTSSEALKRKIAIEGLDHLFGEVIVPTEKVTEFKNGKKKTVERKIWPGYIAVQMHVNDDTWFAIRETSGIGDFTGASGKPAPMQPNEIAMILPKEEGEESEDDTPKLNIKFKEGEKVKVTDGNFENFEGEVDSIDQQSGKITVMISIFGRSTPVELEYWQVEAL